MTAGIKPKNIKLIAPQSGFQQMFASSKADIVIGGSGAGVGKTFSLLIDPLKHITKVEGFGGVIFRRTTPQIKQEGGLWDKSLDLYSKIKGTTPRDQQCDWRFTVKNIKKKNKISFKHLQYEKDKEEWQGSEICYLGWDELTHFTKTQFFYLLTRNRSICGVKPYVRCTCNPDPWSWVRDLLVSGGYVNDLSGDPIPEMEGVIRYFLVNGKGYFWGDSYQEVYEQARHILDPLLKSSGSKIEDLIKSFTFISGSIYDNKALLEKDPSYLGNLINQDEQTVSQLLGKNWNIKVTENDIYNYNNFNKIFDNPEGLRGDKRITADIALEGRNKLVIKYWDRKVLEDILIVDKSSGKKVIQLLKDFQIKYRVPNNKVLYDADGVGLFVGGTDGFIPDSVPFHGGGKVIDILDYVSGEMITPNYARLKPQCIYMNADSVDRGEYSISEKVANTMYDDTMTVKQRYFFELKAFQKLKPHFDGKKRVIDKNEMKTLLNGDSPDLMDAFWMNEYHELVESVDNFAGLD